MRRCVIDGFKSGIGTLFILVAIFQTLFFGQGLAQPMDSTYPETLWAANDSFQVSFSYSTWVVPFKISGADTLDMGSDGAPGLSATIHYGKDSLLLNYRNLPYEQVIWIHFKSPNGKTVYHLHFNAVTAAFPLEYIEKNNNSVRVEIPEVYELANIIWTLSPTGQRAHNLNKQGEYYQRVIKYFHPYLNHPIFQKLDFPPDDYTDYYDFRENSFCFSLRDGKLVDAGPYYYVTGNDEKNHNSLFKKLLPLVQDFADKSNFRSFYRNNGIFYENEVQLEQKRMPVKKMWNWLEEKFPGIQFNSYKVIFSPLIGATHSTQQFGTFHDDKLFRESVMFVAGPGIFDNKRGLSEEQKTGLLSGIVFTEIDHNYVNQVSEKYRAQIDSIFSIRQVWTSSGGDTKFYDKPMSVFNEYMTHGVFCLYVLDNFDSATAAFIIKDREALMTDWRHYIKFREFDKALIEIYKQNMGSALPAIFPQVLQWCRTQI